MTILALSDDASFLVVVLGASLLAIAWAIKSAGERIATAMTQRGGANAL
jgi:hypothetical protein